jgi:hypothetical protein
MNRLAPLHVNVVLSAKHSTFQLPAYLNSDFYALAQGCQRAFWSASFAKKLAKNFVGIIDGHELTLATD